MKSEYCFLEDDKSIKIKSLIELDKEHNTSLKKLEEWQIIYLVEFIIEIINMLEEIYE